MASLWEAFTSILGGGEEPKERKTGGSQKPPMPNAHEIIPGVWLGNIHSAHDLGFLKSKKISVVVNCSKDIPFLAEVNTDASFTKYRVPVHDNLQEEEIKAMTKYIPTIVPHILQHINAEKRNVLIHCYAGMQRSAAVLACCLMKRYKLSMKECISYIQQKRPIAFRPGVNFFDSIRAYESMVNHRPM